ncbi:MAG: hypothetical protein GKR97_03680 [Rhizobiaceae bacterium]|nr:hypothetical protein [Rhizobiaceae bacterium]
MVQIRVQDSIISEVREYLERGRDGPEMGINLPSTLQLDVAPDHAWMDALRKFIKGGNTTIINQIDFQLDSDLLVFHTATETPTGTTAVDFLELLCLELEKVTQIAAVGSSG